MNRPVATHYTLYIAYELCQSYHEKMTAIHSPADNVYSYYSSFVYRANRSSTW